MPEGHVSHHLTEALASVLSPESRVLSAQEAQEAYGSGTEGFERRIVGAVRVGQEADIGALLKLANELASTDSRFCLYPLSSGKNWGYGSALPHSDALAPVILDLSGLKAIPFFDPELGLVTVQPGVTQADLRAFLDRSGHQNLMVPVTGAGPECSLLGNAMERGYGITPHMDHFAAVNSLKAYLPDGRKYQPRLCDLDATGTEIADKCFKWGIGPYLDGLFTQSSLGVVTEITFRLREKPEGFDSFYFRFPNDADLEKAVALVADILRQQEGVVGAINLMDRRRVIAMMAPNPKGPERHEVMTDAQVKQLAREYDIPAWTVAGSLYGSRRVVAAARRDIKARLRGVRCQKIFSSGWLIKAGRLATSWAPGRLLERERGMIQALDQGIEIMRGVPNEVALPLCYWRTTRPENSGPLNPARDGCGLLWYAPLVPMKAERMRQLVELVRSVCPRFGIEPMVTLTNFHHDCADSTIPVLFNQKDPEAVSQAWACLNELVDKGCAQGLVPYRLNIEQQNALAGGSIAEILGESIRSAMDPRGVLMAGRYQRHKKTPE